ncbi:hypothetical protein [Actinomadura macra]|uniref:hypothetical protein n=1 Tax=Actinomadura macra TaxID=46164 RepID=UPI000AC7D658|nr:hypothetical protein [Actinomadura macra]
MNVLTRTCPCKKRTTTKHQPHGNLDRSANRAHPHALARLRTLLQRRIPDRFQNSITPDRPSEPLARVFGHPQGAGFIGPGADSLLRAILTEALTSKIGVSWIIATQHDLNALWSDALNDTQLTKFPARLHVAETLEAAIERLEFEANAIAAPSDGRRPPTTSTVLWFTKPGPDADVVHQTLQRWPDSNLIALIAGAWPYGPTHFTDHDGPRALPHQPINLLSAHQAADKLRAFAALN